MVKVKIRRQTLWDNTLYWLSIFSIFVSWAVFFYRFHLVEKMETLLLEATFASIIYLLFEPPQFSRKWRIETIILCSTCSALIVLIRTLFETLILAQTNSVIMVVSVMEIIVFSLVTRIPFNPSLRKTFVTNFFSSK